LFDEAWLAKYLAATTTSAQDVMATLAELTARTAVADLLRYAPATTRVLVCGGGAFNTHVLSRLSTLSGAAFAVSSTSTAGVPPDQVEALAFAWLASAFVERRAGNLPAATGARGPRVLGALYPAS
jgi:anhydro-N-acetylmuramic acid kinase